MSRAPTRCAFSASRWIGWTKPVTFDAPPRQIVRVMLHLGREHDAAGCERIPEGQLVDGLGGVLSEDHRVGPGIGAHKALNDVVRLLVGGRADARFVAGASMHARVVGQEALDRLHDFAQRWRGHGVVQIDVRDQPPVEQRRHHVGSDPGCPASVTPG